MKFLLLGLLVLSAAACTSMSAIYKNYNTMVNVKDGVDEQEAKLIAQKKIISTVEKRDYRISRPDIKTTPEALRYPDYWFVVFGHNWFSPISNDPLAKTYTELREAQFVVVIHKQTGETPFVGQWFPKRDATFDWVFNPDAYKAANPLALPPARKSEELF